ncbi:MAG: hypothetical protein ACM31P_02065 [Actinomycetota bacterium]
MAHRIGEKNLALAREADWMGEGRVFGSSDILGGLLACLLPTLMFIEVEVGGRLFLSEILLVCLAPLLIAMRGRMLATGLPRQLLMLGALWLLAQVLTDEIRGTPFADWSRGWAKIALVSINFISIFLLLNGSRFRYLMFAAGIALGQILGYFYNPNEYAYDYPWKFGYGTAVTLLAILAASSLSFAGRLFSAGAMLAMGAVNFYMGFRSLGLVCLLGGCILLLMRPRRSLSDSPVKTALLAGIAMIGVVSFYEHGASQGYFGEQEQEKYRWQSAGTMGVVVGARSEILASAQAVKDSPLIGHGSWAKDPKYVFAMADELEALGYEVHGVLESDLIPSHSYLMGAWVEAGVVGAVFWSFGLILICRVLFRMRGIDSILAPLVAFEALNFLWAIPFSPFGAEARLHAAFDLALLIYALSPVRPADAAESDA